MSVRSGGRTPWMEWDGELGPGGVVLYRNGNRTGDLDLLVEAIRSDGISSNLGEAYRFLDSTTWGYAHYGYVDGSIVPTVCDENGVTADGEQVDQVTPCVFAMIGVS